MPSERPVKCLFCKGRMYYEGEPLFESEIVLKVEAIYGTPAENAYYPEYAHRRCFDAARAADAPASVAPETCARCGHNNVSDDGHCQETVWEETDIEAIPHVCACKCIFPSTGVAVAEVDAEKIAREIVEDELDEMISPNEFAATKNALIKRFTTALANQGDKKK